VRDLVCTGTSPISFDISEGELLGLVGLRGAGQERIGRALFGCEPFNGSVLLRGEAPDLSSPRQAMASGIGLIARDRTEESVALSLSIRENTYLNPGAVGRGIFSLLSPRGEADLAHAIGHSVGLRPNDPDLPVEALSGGNQQKIVIGKWLSHGARLFIFDEPTVGVDVGTKAEIYRLFAKLLKEGAGIILISSYLPEVYELADRLHVFRGGRLVASHDFHAATHEQVLSEAIGV
ncbi:sugar ABC transporter ATP-binding protein, partial [Pseudomonas sp. BGM005]|nr:sugar ABC transporter ATP-binding protein [Pseudomonas sp. BG5]